MGRVRERVTVGVVYVHGIGNRAGDQYTEAAMLRDRLFQANLVRAVFPGGAEIHSPYWGDYGGDPRWGLASADINGLERLGGTDELAAEVSASRDGPPEARLLGIAHESLTDAVDALYSVTDFSQDDSDEAVEFAAKCVVHTSLRESLYPDATEVERYPWLSEVHDDLAFLDRLVAEVAPGGGSTMETLGGVRQARDALAVGVGAVRRAATKALTVPPVQFFRRRLGFYFAHGFGDIVVYLADRGSPERPGPIVSVVADAVARAAENGEPVVVVAHSMGGNIVYDLLSHYRPDLAVDVLVTVGSQVGLFEELKLFAASRPDIVGPSMRVPVPGAIRSWVNVVDRADPLSFRTSTVFERATDYVYPSDSIWAHSAYLRQPHFHARLAHRVVEALR